MKNVLMWITVAPAALFISCAPSQEVISFWKNPEAPHGKKVSAVFVAALTSNRAARNIVETDLATAATARGFKVVRSIDAAPSSLTNDAVPSKEELLGEIRDSKCDAVFTVSLLDVKSTQRYVPGTTYSTPYGGVGYAGYAPYPAYGYYGNYTSYIGYAYPMATTPGYYTEDKQYFIESNLYDADSGSIRWSMQSSAYNPASLNDFSKEYTRLLADELDKQNSGASK